MDSKQELLLHFFKHSGWQLNRCLAPGMACTSEAIRAHSIQNSQVLDILARNGHVVAPIRRIEKGIGPVISFEDVGRNKATTFAGFCAEHDSSIFSTIDTASFDPMNLEHLFLIAYRAVARELHAQMDGAAKIQGTYQKRVKLGIDRGDVPTQAGLVAVDHMMSSYETYEYKCLLDNALVSKNYAALSHQIITINHEEPTIAVSSHFDFDNLLQNGERVRATLNILPTSRTESVVVFSYLPIDHELVRSALDRILSAEGAYQKYLLSKLILNNCENFVVSPSCFDQWSETKKQSITQYFVQTITVGNLEAEDQNLYLF